jgi:hypothetical protein
LATRLCTKWWGKWSCSAMDRDPHHLSLQSCYFCNYKDYESRNCLLLKNIVDCR